MELMSPQSLRLQGISGGVGTASNHRWTNMWTVALVLTMMMTDFGHSSLQTGYAPSLFPDLRQPRIQLVCTRSDQGALIQLYNVPEISDKGNIPIRCSVTGGTWKRTQQGGWQQTKGVTLYDPSRPIVWKPAGISGGHLQTRTEVKVAYKVEGLLECTYVPMNLSSNQLVLRFENTSSIVVGLRLPSSELIYDALEDYSYNSSHNIVARLLSKETVAGGVNIVARVTYNHGNDEVDDGIALEAVENLTRLIARANNGTVEYTRSNRYCQPREEGGYAWPVTTAGRTAVPLNPCVGGDGAPGPRRLCTGDFLRGAYWEEAWSGPAGPCTRPGARTNMIQNIILSANEEGSLEKLRSEVVKGPPLRSNEIILVSRFLTNFARNFTKGKPGVTLSPQNVETLAKIVDRVLDSEREVIAEADDASGVSEDLVDAVDSLVSAAVNGPSPANVSKPHFAAATSPRGSNILGVAAISAKDPSEGAKLVHVSCNTSVEEVVAMSPDAAVLLLECPNGRRGVASTIFEDDTLFIPRGKREHAASPVIGFTLADGGDRERASGETVTVLVLFSMENEIKTKCSFWGKEERAWSGGGCAPVPQSELPDNMRGCLCTHLTHFAMIISTVSYEVEEVDVVRERWTEDTSYGEVGLEEEGGDNSTRNNYTTPKEYRENCSAYRKTNDPLIKLSLVACLVSLVFLLGIFLVAALYPSWRSGAGRKIQLHLSASLALLMTAYSIVAVLPTPVLPGFPAGFCVAMGALLHYSLLAAFSWTLVVAILQALRLSPRSVLDSRSRTGTHLVIKVSAFGWGLPLIPVVINLTLGSAVYPVRPCTALCYPEGVAFYATVFTPVALAIVVNTIVFATIMRYMFCAQAVGMRVHHGARDRLHLRRFLFTLFLFVLLGLNWAIGLLLEAVKWNATAHRYIAYVFCSTATLQGTSLFLFFVACERRVSGKISDDLARLKRQSYDVASRFRRMRSIQSTASDKFSSTPSTPPHSVIGKMT